MNQNQFKRWPLITMREGMAGREQHRPVLHLYRVQQDVLTFAFEQDFTHPPRLEVMGCKAELVEQIL